MTPALEIKKLSMEFGGLKAVQDLDISIPQGGIYGLIGPNGAGKTTVFNMLSGIYEPTRGDLFAFGQRLNGMKPFEVTSHGLARTFQNIRLFKELTVLENLRVAADHHPRRKRSSILSSLFQTPAARQNRLEQTLFCSNLLGVFDLEKRLNTEAKNLPYGCQRKLEIARAMATGAQLLLLDEPAAGLNPQETAELMTIIKRIQTEFKLTLFLIEHDMRLVMGICERIFVLDYGIKIAEGSPQEIQHHPRVIEAYLGTHGNRGKNRKGKLDADSSNPKG